jgi:hypothetical protein
MYRTTSSRSFLILLLGGSFVIGCTQDNTVAQESTRTTKPDFFIPLGAPAGQRYSVQLAKATTEAERTRLNEAYSEAGEITHEARQIIDQTTDWQQAHQEVRALLERHIDHPFAYLFEQTAASHLLEARLLPAAETSTEYRDAVAYYTDLLLKNEHPDASVLLPALRKLEGHQSAAKQQAATEAAIGYARALLEREPCEACLPGAAFDDIKDSRQQRLYRIQAALNGQ